MRPVFGFDEKEKESGFHPVPLNGRDENLTYILEGDYLLC